MFVVFKSFHCSVLQMYSEGSEFLPQNNETALKYFKKASELVRIHVFISELENTTRFNSLSFSVIGVLSFRVIQWGRVAWAWPIYMEEESLW